MKTSELTGAALDWAVAKAEGKLNDVEICAGSILYGRITSGFVYHRRSANWAQGGPIIEKEGMDLNPHGVDSSSGRTHWRAAIQWLDESDFEAIGATPLEAAMRCYVASKLGDTVDIPDELTA